MRKANFHSNARASWNNRAGTNRNSRDVRGKHTENRGYKPGDNWIECQRCGFDVYASEAREDGYREGLIVCPKCYDAPHPQDYVRAFDDTLTPYGFATGAVEYDRTGAEGSTDNPSQTSFTADDLTGSLSAISAQTDAELDTISTLTVTTNFPTAVYDTLLGGDQSVSDWSATGLPSGLTINSSGQITGTVGGSAFDDTPYSVTVTAIYANGHRITNVPFTWNITELSGPETISNLHLWWDTSETGPAAPYVFSDTARTTPITDGGFVLGVTDRSGNGRHAVTEDTDANNAGVWRETGQNSIGTLDCALNGLSQPTSIEIDTLDVITQIYTVVAVGKMATPDVTERHALIGMTASTGTEMRISRTGDGGANELTTIGVGTSDDGRSWSTEVGEWWGFLMEINGSSSGVQYISRGSATIQDATPAFNSHDASTVAAATLRFGAGVDGIPNIRSGWNEEV
jgi:hypothetical protein